ncbi:DUF4252 domain-containing protein [Porifericola rhodea]|uniref:DUF4252 domain-containing protein n=1 Tax=Porifericola rhodea TaxID=930972 RepID=UPI002666DB01|nr:DUF4252 domain-containing protein [Porifericola rhodea]WKN30235.1 DUF4252 domain-containing protein [Porifericola rhodea]
MKALFLTTTVLLLSSQLQAQSETVKQFILKNNPSASMYFYPSTLRMLNLEQNPEFYQLVRDIKKLSFLTFDKGSSSFNKRDILEVQKQLTAEQYEELFMMEDKGTQIYVYAKGKAPEAYVSMVNNNTSLMLFDLQGHPDLNALISLIQNGFNFSGIANVASLTQTDHQEEH